MATRTWSNILTLAVAVAVLVGAVMLSKAALSPTLVQVEVIQK